MTVFCLLEGGTERKTKANAKNRSLRDDKQTTSNDRATAVSLLGYNKKGESGRARVREKSSTIWVWDQD
jgi:hypothetical protein